MIISGKQLTEAGFSYLGISYKKMDCQAFVEQCLRDCGVKKDLAGSNAWYREVLRNGWAGTPEECVKKYGKVPAGAFLFILAFDGGEEKRGYRDGLGNASHIGIVTGRGEGAIHSSSSRGCVAESRFRNRTIPGGWNRVGLWNRISYEDGAGSGGAGKDSLPGAGNTGGENMWRPTIRKGSMGDDVLWCQETLEALGYDIGKSGADGIFGLKTLEAVKAFQRDNGLVADGIAGPMTYEALEKAAEAGKPAERLYTVTVPHLNAAQAEELAKAYFGALKEEE